MPIEMRVGRAGKVSVAIAFQFCGISSEGLSFPPLSEPAGFRIHHRTNALRQIISADDLGGYI